jgi:hypothetical protein
MFNLKVCTTKVQLSSISDTQHTTKTNTEANKFNSNSNALITAASSPIPDSPLRKYGVVELDVNPIQTQQNTNKTYIPSKSRIPPHRIPQKYAAQILNFPTRGAHPEAFLHSYDITQRMERSAYRGRLPRTKG